jgi:arabinogalactan oligomer/maltooligosaccharide transport system substrate-binding protein
VKNDPIISAFKPVVDAATARPWIPEGGQFFGPLDTMATEVLVQGKDPKASLDDVAKKYKSDVVPAYSS